MTAARTIPVTTLQPIAPLAANVHYPMGAALSATAQPTVAQAATAQPTVAQAAMAQPMKAQTATNQPMGAQAATGRPMGALAAVSRPRRVYRESATAAPAPQIGT